MLLPTSNTMPGERPTGSRTGTIVHSLSFTLAIIVESNQVVRNRVCLTRCGFLFTPFHSFLATFPHHASCRDFLLEALTVLKNRGYDSAGLATMPEEGGSMVSIIGFGRFQLCHKGSRFRSFVSLFGHSFIPPFLCLLTNTHTRREGEERTLSVLYTCLLLFCCSVVSRCVSLLVSICCGSSPASSSSSSTS